MKIGSVSLNGVELAEVTAGIGFEVLPTAIRTVLDRRDAHRYSALTVSTSGWLRRLDWPRSGGLI
ncbi:hypothetical protein GCM10020219_041300 [Nonomuraea dietziae]